MNLKLSAATASVVAMMLVASSAGAQVRDGGVALDATPPDAAIFVDAGSMPDAGGPGPSQLCSTATLLGDLTQGTATLPITVNGQLSSTPANPDIDFYQLSGGTPGTQLNVMVTGLGTTTATGGMAGPLVGLFDSTCNLIAVGRGYSDFAVSVPMDGVVILAVTQEPDYGFTGGGVGTYQLTISLRQSIGSITGVVVDATTGSPINYFNNPNVELDQCFDLACTSFGPVVNIWPDWWSGAFSITTNWWGQALAPGAYRVFVSAAGYQPYTQVFSVGLGQNLDLGLLQLVPIPTIGSISGAVVDAKTGAPLQGQVNLSQCLSPDCIQRMWVSYGWTDMNGRFFFSQGNNGLPLPVGDYQLDFNEYYWPSRHLPYTSPSFHVGAGENYDTGDLQVQPVPTLRSISGRVVDALTHAALSGTSDYFATVYVQVCSAYACSYVQGPTDASGRFSFDKDAYGYPLFAGTAWIQVAAQQYQAKQFTFSDLRDGEARNVGDLAIDSNPVRFSNTQACAAIPGSGGRCRFSVTMTNGQAAPLNATVWSEISAYGLGSFIGNSAFSIGKQSVGFGPGTRGVSKTVSFDLLVPATVQNYATFCATVYAGQDAPNPFLNTIGASYLFCMYKDPNAPSYRPVSERDGKELMRKAFERLEGRPSPNPAMQRRPDDDRSHRRRR